MRNAAIVIFLYTFDRRLADLFGLLVLRPLWVCHFPFTTATFWGWPSRGGGFASIGYKRCTYTQMVLLMLILFPSQTQTPLLPIWSHIYLRSKCSVNKTALKNCRWMFVVVWGKGNGESIRHILDLCKNLMLKSKLFCYRCKQFFCKKS